MEHKVQVVKNITTENTFMDSGFNAMNTENSSKNGGFIRLGFSL
jgi:hypothetical protein